MVSIRFEVNGKDISEEFKKNFEFLQLVDRDGTESDELNVELLNKIKRPSYEDEIKLWIDEVFYGAYLVQESETNDLNVLGIRATGTNFSNNLKTKRTKSWNNTTLNAIVKEKAIDNGLNFKGDFTEVEIQNLIQSNESDLHFLSRLAKEYDAIFSTKNNTLLFVSRENELPVFSVDLNVCKPWSIRDVAKKSYGSCVAKWRDTKENKELSVTAGDGEPRFVLKDTFKDEKEAKTKAEAKLQQLNRGTKEGSLAKRGEYISAGSHIEIINSLQDNGKYTVNTVYTTVDRYGYRVEVDFSN